MPSKFKQELKLVQDQKVIKNCKNWLSITNLLQKNPPKKLAKTRISPQLLINVKLRVMKTKWSQQGSHTQLAAIILRSLHAIDWHKMLIIQATSR